MSPIGIAQSRGSAGGGEKRRGRNRSTLWPSTLSRDHEQIHRSRQKHNRKKLVMTGHRIISRFPFLSHMQISNGLVAPLRLSSSPSMQCSTGQGPIRFAGYIIAPFFQPFPLPSFPVDPLPLPPPLALSLPPSLPSSLKQGLVRGTIVFTSIYIYTSCKLFISPLSSTPATLYFYINPTLTYALDLL